MQSFYDHDRQGLVAQSQKPWELRAMWRPEINLSAYEKTTKMFECWQNTMYNYILRSAMPLRAVRRITLWRWRKFVI